MKRGIKMRLILASGSQQRKDLFDFVGWKYEVIKSKEEEKSDKKDPEEYVKDLSKVKAKSVASQIESNAIIVAADTVIYMDGKIYEKPKTKEEAYRNIQEMRGKITYGVTGVTIKDLYQNREISYSDTVEVHIRNVSDKTIRWYVENEKNILSRCGYTILGKGIIFVDKVIGDYNTVFGISISKLVSKLEELGYSVTDFELN